MTRILLTLLLASLLGTAQAQSFTYRGSLEDSGEPAQGRYDLRLSLYADRLGTQVLAAPLELDDVAVTDGRFAVGLDFADLPAGIGTGWLEVAVQSGDEGGWETLEGRSEVLLDGLVCPTPWGLEGNAGTNMAINFLGTTDSASLEIRVGNERILRLEPPRQLNDFFGANILGGSPGNELGPNAVFATVAGGGGIGLFGNPLPNRALGIGDFIGGGAGNTSGTGIEPFGEGSFAVVVGGRQNQATGNHSFLGGGNQNRVTGEESVLVGGSGNRAEARLSVVVGGASNQAFGEGGFIGGGSSHRSFGTDSVIVGGFGNATRGFQSSVAGGLQNCAGGDLSWAGGSRAKTRPGNNVFPEPVGGACRNVPQTGNSFGDRGTFVWSDSQDADFVSTGSNQFLVRASNGLGLNTNTPTPSHLTIGKNDGSNNILALGFSGNVTRWRIGGTAAAGAGSAFEVQSGGDRVLMRIEDLAPGARMGISRAPTANTLEVQGEASKTTAGSWLANSDARIKTEVHAIDGALDRILQIRPVSFRYTEDYRAAHPEIREARYYNVIAQEFAQVFPDAVKGSGEFLPGQDQNSTGEILQVDTYPALITAIAAVQELAAKLQNTDVRLTEVVGENAQLRAEIAALNEQAEELDALRTELALLRELLLPAVAGMQ